MINAAKLLADLKRLRKSLDADLRVTHATGKKRDAVQAEWREAFDLGRTRDPFEVFLDGALDQSVVHWILGCVFLRFLEDNQLVDRPFLSGPGERLELAKERQEAHFRFHPHDSDAEYLFAIFAEAAQLPGLAGLYDSLHNPLFQLPLSGDGAMALIRFFREVLPETGELSHDFTDRDWSTRFLGDLYQDLSEEARKRYALLQTPDFVESWILDRTLEPAIREFGHERVTMIDPACGSGHFLLGGFDRLLREWQRFAPGLPPAEHAQRALDAIAGVDLNPFAVEIARFRLLVAALRAAGIKRITSAPGFRLHLAAGDSLLHGRHFFRHEFGGGEEGFGRVLRHHYAAEDTTEIDQILGRQYHAVVGNPPYITPKDPAMRDAYREIYRSCHMKYGLGAPFAERIFDLAKEGTAGHDAGFVGLIVANSFMKREFGSKLIQEVFPRLDLTHIVDCSGAYIPGHGTPTVILFGRNRPPLAKSVRTVRGIRGEPTTPENAAQGLVWSAIVAQTDLPKSASAFISTEDTPRNVLASHPWNMGGGGAADVQALIEEGGDTLGSKVFQIGFSVVTGADEAYACGNACDLRRLTGSDGRPFVSGEDVRDYRIRSVLNAIWPYDAEFKSIPLEPGTQLHKHFWRLRTSLSNRKLYGQPFLETGLNWYEYGEVNPNKQRIKLSLTFAEVASHNHFAIDFGRNVFSQTAPVIKLPAHAGEDDHFALLGLLNSSTACFWMKQVSHQKQMTGGDGVRVSSRAKVPFQFSGTRMKQFPLPVKWKDVSYRKLLSDLARRADELAKGSLSTDAFAVISNAVSQNEDIALAWEALLSQRAKDRSNLILLQEDMDFLCYEMYGTVAPAELRGLASYDVIIDAGDRPFCILTQENQDNFPVPAAIPAEWPSDVATLWRKRIAAIENSVALKLIEDPHYKRRWIGNQGLFNHDARSDEFRNGVQEWLLDRIETLLSATGQKRLISTNTVADLVQRDSTFMAVVPFYAGQKDFHLEAVVSELMAKESVPFIASLRYSETGLRKHALWKEVWDKQRLEDSIDEEVISRRAHFRSQAERRAQEQWRVTNPRHHDEDTESYSIRMRTDAAKSVEVEVDRLVSEEQSRRRREEVGEIPVPPKYVSKDFQSADYWRLREGLDVPKERFISFPHCQRDADGSLVVIWAGYHHLDRALAIAAYYQERKDNDGWTPERLVPLLAGVIELLPWLLQWHNEYDPDLGARMGDYFVDFVQTEARAIGMTEAAVAAWMPAATPRRSRNQRVPA